MDRTRSHNVLPNQVGKRLDNIVRDMMPDISLGRIAKLIRKKRIRVNDKKARHQQRLQEGDIITFFEAPLVEAWTKKGRSRVMSQGVAEVSSLDFHVLFEDEHLLAVAKPPGLLVHGTNKEPEADTLIDQALAYLAQSQIEQSDDAEGDERDLTEFVRPTPKFQPSLAHRIDRNTSGAVLIAKTLECLQELTRMIKKRRIDKRYLGLIKGGLSGMTGEINAPVSRRDHAGKKAGRQQVDVGEKHKAARPALTRYRVLASRGAYTLAEFELVTGRTHQIRAHLRHVGSALIGDDEYGDREINRHAKKKLGLRRHFLHAMSLKLQHPLTGEALEIVAPLPEDLAHALGRAGFEKEDLPAPLAENFETSIKELGGEGA